MKHFLLIAAFFSSLQGFSQLFPAPAYPRNYFRDPLAVPMSLAANFGELRPNHYHMGLDIRTQHRENLPVFAAADGYVARVSIEPGGFGQAVYINHPNGYTTVYGHLNKFFPALASWIHHEQYRRQSWQVYLEIPPSLFPVKKGDLIAYSGNTGGSQGPHLHFEIRRTAGDINLNPLLFGLPVPDHTAPDIARLAWYDRELGVYDQSPHLLPVRINAAGYPGGASSGRAYTITPNLLVVHTTRISFALSASDAQTGSNNPNGIFEADLFEDERPVIGFQMDRISYDNTRNINAHIDYKTREKGGPFLQQLFFLPGYPLPSIYAVPAAKNFPSGEASDPAALPSGTHPNGVLDLRDSLVHRIRIEVTDSYGNASGLDFQVQYRPFPGPAALAAPGAAPGTTSETFDAGKTFFPGMLDGLEIKRGAFYLSEKSLYDSVNLHITNIDGPGSGYSLPGGMSEVFRIGDPGVPLLQPVLVRLQSFRAFNVDSIPGWGWVSLVNRIVMVRKQGGTIDVQRPEWDKDTSWASARFREFGDFQLVEDTIPPAITPIGPLEHADLSKASRIAFSIKDNLGALVNFRAELDGSWLCFTNDKGLAFIYTFDEHCPPGTHTLRVSVADVAGNKTVKDYHFTR